MITKYRTDRQLVKIQQFGGKLYFPQYAGWPVVSKCGNWQLSGKPKAVFRNNFRFDLNRTLNIPGKKVFKKRIE